MRILGYSNITLADITATDIVSSTFTDKLKTFQLVDNMNTIANSTVIDLTFNTTEPEVNCVALCGTNLTSNAVITLSYSDTDIESPDASIVLPKFSTLNQVFFLTSVIQKKFWRITIEDSSLTTLFIGYIYIGKYLEFNTVEFPHTPGLNVVSNPSVNASGQGYGSKFYNANTVAFIFSGISYDDLVDILNIIQGKQNIDPVLLVEYEGSYELDLYRPKYGVLHLDSYPYPMVNDPLTYNLNVEFEERF